jgi:hypothetical protein
MRLSLTAAVVAVGLCALVAGAATTVGTMEPTTGTWRAYRGSGFTTLVCSNSSEAAMLACIEADAERRSTTTRYQLRYPNRYVTVTYSASPPPPPPPPTTAWKFCAAEYQTCSFTGTRRVRFGLNTSWVERDLTAVNGSVPCRIATFGSDPLVGVAKRCELRNTDSPPATGTATLSWTPPTQNTDGSALTNLAGYRISYGASATELILTVQVSSPGASSYTISNLSPGTYFFAVRAYTSGGTESANSNVGSKVIL